MTATHGLILLALAASMAPAVLVLLHVRWRAAKRDMNRDWQQLAVRTEPPKRTFDPFMVSGLPEPARRFLRFCIQPGTPLYSAAEIEMKGTFSFGSESRYQPLTAVQILSPPSGMIWAANIGHGLRAVSGSDGVSANGSWTRFAWLDLLPVALIDGSPDHYRSAFGRMIAESVFWTPAALLGALDVVWHAPDDNTARALIGHSGLLVTVDVRVEPNGEPSQVSFQRWSNANVDKAYRLQPFGGYLSQFREIDGIKVPTRIEAGNFFGTADYFPFYRVDVQKLRWLDKSPALPG